jgi:hypothetical protein
MAIIINKIIRTWAKRSEFFQGGFLTPSLKKSRANLHHGSLSKFASKTFIHIFQWIPSLLINPASLLLMTIAGSITFMVPFFKKAWHVILLG